MPGLGAALTTGGTQVAGGYVATTTVGGLSVATVGGTSVSAALAKEQV